MCSSDLSQGCFSTTGSTYQSDVIARMDAHIHVGQHHSARNIAEVDIHKFNLTFEDLGMSFGHERGMNGFFFPAHKLQCVTDARKGTLDVHQDPVGIKNGTL